MEFGVILPRKSCVSIFQGVKLSDLKIDGVETPVLRPKEIKVDGYIKKIRGLEGGAFDPNETDSVTGMSTYRVYVDRPGGVVLKCQCGHYFRVVDASKNFRCENPKGGCHIIWHKILKPTGESDPETGKDIYADVEEELPVKHANPYSGRPEETLVPVPLIWGENMSHYRHRDRARKAAAGQPLHYQPQPRTVSDAPLVTLNENDTSQEEAGSGK